GDAGVGERAAGLAVDVVDDDERRRELDDPFEVGLEEAADLGERLYLWWILRVGVDADEQRRRVERGDDLGRRWGEGHHAGRAVLLLGRRGLSAGHESEQEQDTAHACP